MRSENQNQRPHQVIETVYCIPNIHNMIQLKKRAAPIKKAPLQAVLQFLNTKEQVFPMIDITCEVRGSRVRMG